MDTNSCTEDDLQDASDYTAENGLIKISSNVTLASEFKTSFNMVNGIYWSSSPYHDNDYGAWVLYMDYNYVGPDSHNGRSNDNRVRCVKDSTSASPATAYTLTLNPNG